MSGQESFNPNSSSELELEKILDKFLLADVVTEYKYDVLSEYRDAKPKALTALTQWKNREVLETEKAYGGCHKCYGKGYATWRHGESYQVRGAYATHDMRNDIKYCDCERGRQLAKVVSALKGEQQ